jgi:hypothetical protein
MENPLQEVMEVLAGAASPDEATRTAAAAQLLAYLREPGFVGVLVVRVFV